MSDGDQKLGLSASVAMGPTFGSMGRSRQLVNQHGPCRKWSWWMLHDPKNSKSVKKWQFMRTSLICLKNDWCIFKKIKLHQPKRARTHWRGISNHNELWEKQPLRNTIWSNSGLRFVALPSRPNNFGVPCIVYPFTPGSSSQSIVAECLVAWKPGITYRSMR